MGSITGSCWVCPGPVPSDYVSTLLPAQVSQQHSTMSRICKPGLKNSGHAFMNKICCFCFCFFGVHKISEGPVPPRGSWQSRRFLRGKLAAHLRWAGAGWDNQGLDGWGYCFPAELQGTEVRGTDIINKKKKNQFHKYSEGPAIWPHWSRWRGYRWIKHRVPAVVTFTFCGKKVNDVLGDNTRVSGEFSKCNGQI